MSPLIHALLVAALAVTAGCTATPEAMPTEAPAAAAPFNELGRPDAPITIVEYSDLQCPYCARHAAQTFPELRRNYVDTGKVRYEARDLPLAMHAYAVPAAVAARCAGEQGRFWEFRDALFMARGRFGDEPYAAMARESGLDVERFEACRRDGRQAANVAADAQRAREQGIASTPAFVIGRTVSGELSGEKVVGAKPYAVFERKIEALLSEAPR